MNPSKMSEGSLSMSGLSQNCYDLNVVKLFDPSNPVTNEPWVQEQQRYQNQGGGEIKTWTNFYSIDSCETSMDTESDFIDDELLDIFGPNDTTDFLDTFDDGFLETFGGNETSPEPESPLSVRSTSSNQSCSTNSCCVCGGKIGDTSFDVESHNVHLVIYCGASCVDKKLLESGQQEQKTKLVRPNSKNVEKEMNSDEVRPFLILRPYYVPLLSNNCQIIESTRNAFRVTGEKLLLLVKKEENVDVKELVVKIEAGMFNKWAYDLDTYRKFARNFVHNHSKVEKKSLYQRLLKEKITVEMLFEMPLSRVKFGMSVIKKKAEPIVEVKPVQILVKEVVKPSVAIKKVIPKNKKQKVLDDIQGKIVRETTRDHANHVFAVNCLKCSEKKRMEQMKIDEANKRLREKAADRQKKLEENLRLRLAKERETKAELEKKSFTCNLVEGKTAMGIKLLPVKNISFSVLSDVLPLNLRPSTVYEDGFAYFHEIAMKLLNSDYSKTLVLCIVESPSVEAQDGFNEMKQMIRSKHEALGFDIVNIPELEYGTFLNVDSFSDIPDLIYEMPGQNLSRFDYSDKLICLLKFKAKELEKEIEVVKETEVVEIVKQANASVIEDISEDGEQFKVDLAITSPAFLSPPPLPPLILTYKESTFVQCSETRVDLGDNGDIMNSGSCASMINHTTDTLPSLVKRVVDSNNKTSFGDNNKLAERNVEWKRRRNSSADKKPQQRYSENHHSRKRMIYNKPDDTRREWQRHADEPICVDREFRGNRNSVNTIPIGISGDRPSNSQFNSPVKWNETHHNRDEAPLSRNEAPFSRNEVPFNQSQGLSGRNETPTNQNETSFNRNQAPFNKNRVPFNKNEASFNLIQASFNRNQANFNRNDPSYSLHNSHPRNNRSMPLRDEEPRSFSPDFIDYPPQNTKFDTRQGIETFHPPMGNFRPKIQQHQFNQNGSTYPNNGEVYHHGKGRNAFAGNQSWIEDGQNPGNFSSQVSNLRNNGLRQYNSVPTANYQNLPAGFVPRTQYNNPITQPRPVKPPNWPNFPQNFNNFYPHRHG
uniref:TFIIS central domain-containing protein n=1 Tax=Rhabditophanes sp. KR3021 TaxID=114890 RepID=A0AC35UHY0_9BILA